MVQFNQTHVWVFSIDFKAIIPSKRNPYSQISLSLISLIKIKPETTQAWLVYDGECPFCSRYSYLLNVREKVGNLTLINARDGSPLVEKIQSIPYDLNEGMVFIYGDDYYFGADALQILGLLSSKGGIFSSMNRILFSSRIMVKISYPILRFGRNMTLKWLNIPQIESGSDSSTLS